MKRRYWSALPTAHIMLRGLIVLNWLTGAAILALLSAMVIAKDWTLTALGFPPSSMIFPVISGLRAIAALGIVAVPLNHVVLARLLAIVESVRNGNPFIPDNASRLRAIAWALLGLQTVSLAIAAIGKIISTPDAPLHLGGGFSVAGWLAILLTFVLAGVFEEAARMHADLEGTV